MVKNIFRLESVTKDEQVDTLVDKRHQLQGHFKLRTSRARRAEA